MECLPVFFSQFLLKFMAYGAFFLVKSLFSLGKISFSWIFPDSLSSWICPGLGTSWLTLNSAFQDFAWFNVTFFDQVPCLLQFVLIFGRRGRAALGLVPTEGAAEGGASGVTSNNEPPRLQGFFYYTTRFCCFFDLPMVTWESPMT